MNDIPPKLVLEGSPALQCVGLVKRFGSLTAVAGLDLCIPRGQLYAFLGPNGAGKTTSLRLISGLLRPDAGEVRIHGRALHLDPEGAKRPLAYVPDDPLLYGRLRPREHLEFVAALWSMSAAEARPRAEELLQTLGLWEKRGEYIDTLSRGMKQKLSLAAALLHSPSLMLLDEPLTGLDAAAARQVKDLLLSFVQGGGTVVLTTHILEVAERLAERVGIIHGGRLHAEGTLEELRTSSGRSQGTLEEIFLQLTGEPSSPAAP